MNKPTKHILVNNYTGQIIKFKTQLSIEIISLIKNKPKQYTIYKEITPIALFNY